METEDLLELLIRHNYNVLLMGNRMYFSGGSYNNPQPPVFVFPTTNQLIVFDQYRNTASTNAAELSQKRSTLCAALRALTRTEKIGKVLKHV